MYNNNAFLQIVFRIIHMVFRSPNQNQKQNISMKLLKYIQINLTEQLIMRNMSRLNFHQEINVKITMILIYMIINTLIGKSVLITYVICILCPIWYLPQVRPRLHKHNQKNSVCYRSMEWVLLLLLLQNNQRTTRIAQKKSGTAFINVSKTNSNIIYQNIAKIVVR